MGNESTRPLLHVDENRQTNQPDLEQTDRELPLPSCPRRLLGAYAPKDEESEREESWTETAAGAKALGCQVSMGARTGLWWWQGEEGGDHGAGGQVGKHWSAGSGCGKY